MEGQSYDDVIFSPEDTSRYLGHRLSVQTLAKKRLDGSGPKFLKLGSRVGYRRSSVDEWLAARERTSTEVHEPQAA